MPAAKATIANKWGDVPAVPVAAEHTTIFAGHEGAGYGHHAQVTSLAGRLYAAWSVGTSSEDDVGQRMVMAASADGGDTWSEPETVSAPRRGQLADGVVTAAGLYAHERTLVAYYGWYEYTAAGLDNGHRQFAGKATAPEGVKWHSGTQTCARVSEDGGRTWSAPRVVVERLVPNSSPQRIAGGRLIMPGNLTFPYTDDPSGLTGWKTSGLPRLGEDYVDDSDGFHRACRRRGDAVHYCEAFPFQTDDGVIHMMLRTSAPWLAVSESSDRGETWSEPRMTKYSDCRSKHQFGRLPDGRFFGLNCPDPTSKRTPLVLATSEDGLLFDKHYVLGAEPHRPQRVAGHGKGGRYGYPHAHVMDDTLYVIYSITKEDIAHCRVNLAHLT